MQREYPAGKINVRFLIILLAIMALLVGGAAVGYKVRKRVVAARELKLGLAALEAKDWEGASKHLRQYLQRYPDNAEILDKYASAVLSIRPSKPEHAATAAMVYRRLLRFRQGDGEIINRLARLYYMRGEYPEVAYVCRQRLQVDASDVRAKLWLSKSLMALRKQSDAVNELKDLVEKHPETVEAYGLLSNLAGAEGTPTAKKAALAWLDQAVEKNPQSASARAQRARFFRAVTGETTRATADLDEAEKLKTTDPRVLLLMAEERLYLGNNEASQKLLALIQNVGDDELLDMGIEPDSFAYARFLAEARLSLARTAKPEGVALADRVLESASKSLRLRVLPIAVDLYLAAGETEKASRAVESYREGLQASVNVTTADTHQLALLSAGVAEVQGKYYEVIRLLEPLTMPKPDNPQVWRLLWRAYDRTNQDGRARNALQEYVARQPGDSAAAMTLASSYRNIDWNRAVQFATRAEQVAPDSPEAKLLRIEGQLRSGTSRLSDTQAQQIAKDLASLQQASPKRVSVRILKAMLDVRQGNRADAEAELEKAVAECDESWIAALELAQLQARAGKMDKAMAMAKIAAEKQPDQAAPRAAMAELYRMEGKPDQAKDVLVQAVASLKDEQKYQASIALAQHYFATLDRKAGLDLLNKLCAEQAADVRPRLVLLEQPELQKDAAGTQRLVDELKTIEGDRGVRWRIEQARLWIRGETTTTGPATATRPASESLVRHEQEVVPLLTYCCEAYPDWQEPVMLLGRAYELLGKNVEAEQVYRRDLETRPNHIGTATMLLNLLERQQRYSESQRILRTLPDAVTGMSGFQAREVQAALGTQNYEAAISQLEKLVAGDAKNISARVLLAILTHRVNRDMARAMKLLDEAKALDPNMVDILSARVAILRLEDKKDEALELLNRAVEERKDFAAYTTRGDFYYATGRNELAEKDFRKLTEMPNEAARGYSVLGAFYQVIGKRDKAIETWEAGLNVDAGSVEIKRELAAVLLAGDRPKELERGRALLEELLRDNPTNAVLLVMQAEDFAKRPDPQSVQKAIALAEKALQQNPGYAPAHLLLIRITRQHGTGEDAQRLIARARGVAPDSPQLLLQQAILELAQNRIANAQHLAQEVLQKDADNIEARVLLAEAALKVNDLAAAEKYNAEILQRNARNSSAAVLRARILAARSQPSEGIASLEEYLKQPAGAADMRAMLTLVDLYRNQKQYERCEELLAKADAMSPGDLTVAEARLRGLAAQDRYDDIPKWIEEHRKDYANEADLMIVGASILTSSQRPVSLQAALKLYQESIDRVPGTLARVGLAQTHYVLGNLQAAIAEYQHVLDVDPNQPQALNDLAWILAIRQKQGEAGLELINRAVLRNGDDPHVLDTRGAILLMLGKLDDARKDLQKCLALPELPLATRASVLRHLGTISVRQGRTAEAQKQLAEALELDAKQRVFDDAERASIRQMMGNAPTTRP